MMPFREKLIIQTTLGLMSVFGVWIELIDRSGALSFPEKTPKQIRNALVKYAIVRRILPHAPKHAVEVAYGDTIVDFGNKLTPEQIEDEPDHISWPIKNNTLYTLVLSGPDVPTHEKAVDKEIQHWVVGNIPGNNVSAGETLTEYRGIIPLYEPGSHRLCYYVYEQPDEEKVTFKDEHVNKSVIGYQRAFFHAEVVRSKYNYEEAIAANFFIVDTTEEDQQMTAR
ncbi:unnamed protein product [Bemisia tabaci]|uniref:Uncharacterized protein n=1 Tax=Bemisia tabaci TaxID=7038 RepID=A0A9P0F4A7_BEMTA|nr:unnamed protein product [Bemisia tabaci]